jgi:exonuclease III
LHFWSNRTQTFDKRGGVRITGWLTSNDHQSEAFIHSGE